MEFNREQSCYECVHLEVCKNWAEIAGHPENLDLNLGCTMFERVAKEFTCSFAQPHKVTDCPIADEVAKAKADTVNKMYIEIKERCIKGGIYPAFVARTIAEVAKEMLEEDT